MDGSVVGSVRGCAGFGGGGLPRKGRGAVVCVAAARAEVSTASFWGGFGSGSPVGVGRELAVVAIVWSWALWRMELAGREPLIL